jgi:hypothetical protein
MTVDIQAVDQAGKPWWFVVAGTFGGGVSGLRSSDVLWRTLGRVASLAQVAPDIPIVVLATALPAPKTPHDQAIRPLIGPMVHTVVELVDPGARDVLGSLAAGVGHTQPPR